MRISLVLMVLGALLSTQVRAQSDSPFDHWLCKDASSLREGSVIKSCGIATEASEDLARERAYLNAEKEFHRICASSADCRDYEKTLEPLRTDCQKTNEGNYTCYRGIQYTLSDKINHESLIEHQMQILEQEKKLLEKQLARHQDLEKKQREIDELKKKLSGKVSDTTSNENQQPYWLKNYYKPSRWELSFILPGIVLNLPNSPNSNDIQFHLGANLKYQAMKPLGIKFSAGYLGDFSDQNGTLISLGLQLYYWQKVFIEPEHYWIIGEQDSNGYSFALGYETRWPGSENHNATLRMGYRGLGSPSESDLFIDMTYIFYL